MPEFSNCRLVLPSWIRVSIEVHEERTLSPGHSFPFITRLTRAHLNFEVKDRDGRRPRAFGASLSSKFRYAFLPPCDEWIFLRVMRGVVNKLYVKAFELRDGTFGRLDP